MSRQRKELATFPAEERSSKRKLTRLLRTTPHHLQVHGCPPHRLPVPAVCTGKRRTQRAADRERRGREETRNIRLRCLSLGIGSAVAKEPGIHRGNTQPSHAVSTPAPDRNTANRRPSRLNVSPSTVTPFASRRICRQKGRNALTRSRAAH